MNKDNIFWVLIIALVCVPPELYLLSIWSPFLFKYGIRIHRRFISFPAGANFELAPESFETAWRERASLPIRVRRSRDGGYVFSDQLWSRSPWLFGLVSFNRALGRIEIEGKTSPLGWLGILAIFLVLLPVYLGIFLLLAYLGIWFSIQRKRLEAIGELFAEMCAQSRAG